MYGDLKDNFVVVQSYANLVEVTLNFLAFFLSTSSCSKRTKLFASLIALTSLAFTMWKTVIYFAYGVHFAAHNAWNTYITLYLIPNGLWILVPFLAIVSITRSVVRVLDLNDNKKLN
jgi:hypothetical protein